MPRIEVYLKSTRRMRIWAGAQSAQGCELLAPGTALAVANHGRHGCVTGHRCHVTITPSACPQILLSELEALGKLGLEQGDLLFREWLAYSILRHDESNPVVENFSHSFIISMSFERIGSGSTGSVLVPTSGAPVLRERSQVIRFRC